MYYPELLDVIEKTGAKEAVEKLDKHLAFLNNRSEKIITPSNIAIKLELDYNIINVMFKYIYEIGLFEKVYIVVCPECGREILTSDQRNLIDRVKDLDYCIKCRRDITIDEDDVYLGYKILKQPQLEEEDIIKETEELLGMTAKSFDTKELETLKELFKKNKENPHDFFYNPSEADIKFLKNTFDSLDFNYKGSTTAQGSALEGLVLNLFNICTGMTATTIIRTEINQIDCIIRNDYCIPLTIYNELGSIVKAECKNEPKRTPGNTYYHKLYGIIEISKSQNEQAVGILFSRKKAAITCTNLAREYFLKNNIIIINIHDDDLDRIINRRENFLDVLQEKIQHVKNNIVTSPEKHKLYRNQDSKIL